MSGVPRDTSEMRLSDERKALAEQFVPLAHKLALRFARRTGVDVDDARSVAMEALVHAARTWNPEVGGFMTHAFAAISWKLNDGNRTNQYHLCIGRSVDRVGNAGSEKQPSIAIASPDRLAWMGDRPVRTDPADQMRRRERRILNESLIAEALTELPERDRAIVELRIARGLTLVQVGELVGLTKERVRQICKQGVDGIRKRHGLPPENRTRRYTKRVARLLYGAVKAA